MTSKMMVKDVKVPVQIKLEAKSSNIEMELYDSQIDPYSISLTLEEARQFIQLMEELVNKVS